MCGINGIFSVGRQAPPIDRGELLRTRDLMTARGPDDAGAWIAGDGRAGLASRRLAIQDLSPAGAQPMAAAGGRVQIAFNGEIYNFRQLAAGLAAAGLPPRGGSDTEVVLALYLRHGEGFLPLLRGMFGLAIWDGRDAAHPRLLLARDPYGIKPLYYSFAAGQLRFASQVKALIGGGQVSRAMDPAGLAGFLLWGSVPEPATLYSAVRCLPAGHLLWIDGDGPGEPRRPPRATAGDDPPAAGAQAAAQAIEQSVAAHLVADVPVAVFLSAGLDSALVAALARRHSDVPLTTLTVGFDVLRGTPRDEAPLAAAVARQLGARHHQIELGRDDFASLWPAALAAMDQPSIDGFNTFVISRAAHQAGFKVVLSGLGGDELFGSYPSFADVPRAARAARWGRRLPGLAAGWPALARRLAPGRPKLAGLLRYGATLPGSYFLRRGLFLPEELPALLGAETAAAGLAAYDPIAAAGAALSGGSDAGGSADPWLAVHRLESALYLRNQLLRDADWASMAWSVELRVPLVDATLHRQLAALDFQPARRQGKAALVRSAAPELPGELWQRPKSGFYIPVVEWLLPGELGPAGHHLGARSRTLARLILAELGIAIPVAPARVAAVGAAA